MKDFEIAAIVFIVVLILVGLTAMLIWTIPKKASLYHLPLNATIIWAIITFALALATIIGGLSLVFPYEEIASGITIFFTIILAAPLAIIFLSLLNSYIKDINYIETISDNYQSENIIETNV